MLPNNTGTEMFLPVHLPGPRGSFFCVNSHPGCQRNFVELVDCLIGKEGSGSERVGRKNLLWPGWSQAKWPAARAAKLQLNRLKLQMLAYAGLCPYYVDIHTHINQLRYV